MKLIYFSDTHLGFNDLDVINNAGINQRKADFYDAFTQVIETILLGKSNYMTHPNDFFHYLLLSNFTFTKSYLYTKYIQDFTNLVLSLTIFQTLDELRGGNNIGFLVFDEVFES